MGCASQAGDRTKRAHRFELPKQKKGGDRGGGGGHAVGNAFTVKGMSGTLMFSGP